MHAVHDPGHADGRRERPDRRRQRRHFQPDAGGEGGGGSGVPGRKRAGNRRPARAAGRTHLAGRALAIPTAGALQVLVKEVWQATAPDQPRESPAPAAEPADESGNPAARHRPPSHHSGQ